MWHYNRWGVSHWTAWHDAEERAPATRITFLTAKRSTTFTCNLNVFSSGGFDVIKPPPTFPQKRRDCSNCWAIPGPLYYSSKPDLIIRYRAWVWVWNFLLKYWWLFNHKCLGLLNFRWQGSVCIAVQWAVETPRLPDGVVNRTCCQ